MKYAAELLAEFAVQLNLTDVPSDVIDYTKKVIADTVAASILGGRMPWSKAVLATAIHSKTEGSSSIIGLPHTVSSSAAAFVNGSYAHANDFDDFYAYGPLHPSAAVWVALPMGEEVRATGADIVTNVILGYEIATRVAEACFSSTRKEKALVERGFHGQPTCGVVAAAAQAARLLRLSSSTIASAMGVAGSYAGGLMQFMEEPADTKRFHFGKASSEGITSAVLAANGFRGPKSVLEGRKGLLNAISGEWVDSKLSENLGSQFHVMSSFLKPVPTMGGNLGCFEAMCRVMENNRLTHRDIESITAELRSQFTGYSIGIGERAVREHYSPPDRYTAEMSLPYLMGLVAFYGRNLKPTHFDKEMRTRADVLELVKRVTVNFAADIDAVSREEAYAMGRVTVRTRQGSKFTETVKRSLGHPHNPMSWHQIRAKFDACAEGAMQREQIEECFDLISHLEECPSVERLGVLLRGAGVTPWPGE
ncbi:MAG TPA: MmgE/PrpD family protein [Burkholderiales bacterium]|nr:MmgE/PrpD family protein [Burkholderiales bacterium]